MHRITALIALFLLISCSDDNISFRKLQGSAFGTSFNITYKDNLNKDFTSQIDSLFYVVNKSLSTYIYESDISKINRGNSTITVDELFEEVFEKSDKIYKETNGYFDPTIGTLVNAWGFGPGKAITNLDTVKVKELMTLVGFNKVKLKKRKIIKQHPKIQLDFNAIAKGYGIDVIGRFLEANDCFDYLIEIGGEIRTRGKNNKNSSWKVAIEDPNTNGTRSYSKIVSLDNEAMASSGNYRKFKINENGKKYVHTINTKTGLAIESDLLSATVIAPLDCADVDAYATAFMAMGLEKSKAFLEQHKDIQAHLIFTGAHGTLDSFTTDKLLVSLVE